MSPWLELLDSVGARAGAAWFWTFAAHLTVSLLIVAVVDRVLPRRRDRARETLWRAALVAPLLSAPMQLAWLPTDVGLRADLAPAVTGLEPADAEPHPFAAIATSDPWALDDREAAAAPAVVPDPSIADSVSLARVATALAWAMVLAGAGFASVRWLRARRALDRALIGRRPLRAETRARRLLDDLHDARDFARVPAIWLSASSAVGSPIAFGGRARREICVPEQALALADPPLRAMLAHELAHHRHGDPRTLTAVHLLRCAVFWHPLVAIAERRLRTLAEFRCDTEAAAAVGPLPLARCLVEVASWVGAPRTATTAAFAPGMAVVTASVLRQRVERLIRDRAEHTTRRAPARAAFAVAGLAALSTLHAPGADFRAITPVSPPPETASASPDAERLAEAAAIAELLVLLEQERNALFAEVEDLIATWQHLPRDARTDRLLAHLEDRLGALDRTYAAVQARLFDHLSSYEDQPR